MKKHSVSQPDVKFIIAVVSILVFSGAFVLIRNTPLKYVMTYTKDSAKIEVASPTPMVIPDGWVKLTNLGFSFSYPQQARAEKRESESLVTFIGPKQVASGRTQTELFDGFSFRVEKVSLQDGEVLETLAQNERDNSERGCENPDGVVTPLKAVSIGGATGFQYSIRGCYVDYTGTLLSYKNTLYRISQMYVGEPQKQEEYQFTTNQMLSSFTFEE